MNSSPTIPPERVNVLGTGIHAVNMSSACHYLLQAAANRQGGFVCVRDVNGIMAAVRDPRLRDIHNRSLLTVPDGMPAVWMGRWRGQKTMGRVYGPDLMLEICRQSIAPGYTHFLYGGKPGVADTLSHRLRERFPGLKIAGAATPPFRPLTETEACDLERQVATVRPDFFWVGISTPKQERFMADYHGRLAATIMLGVGAAFDIHAGLIRDAPAWIKPTGFQWVYRLCQEPRRLWRRYLFNHPAFIVHLLIQASGVRAYPMTDEPKSSI